MWRGLLRRLVAAAQAEGDDCGPIQEPTFTQISTAAWDPDRQGVGSSGWIGDLASSALTIPSAASSPTNRYFFRLCGGQIADGMAARVVEFAQYLAIGSVMAGGGGVGFVPVSCQVLSPLWSFVDGNVAWGLTWRRWNGLQEPPDGLIRPPATSRRLEGLDSALLFEGATPTPYVPAAGGIWPGSPIGSLGLIRDVRSPWGKNTVSFDFTVEGPAEIIAWASVKQTNPETRPSLPAPTDLGAICQEDRFVLEYPDAIYRKIAASLTLEIGPLATAARYRERAR